MNTDRFRVAPGDRRALTRIEPDETTHFESKAAARAHVQVGTTSSRLGLLGPGVHPARSVLCQ